MSDSEGRPAQEIYLDIKKCISKLLDATKRSGLAEHDILVSVVGLVKLEKELEDLVVGQFHFKRFKISSISQSRSVTPAVNYALIF